MATRHRTGTKVAAIATLMVAVLEACSRVTGSDPNAPNISIETQNLSPPALVSPANGRGIGVPSVVTLRWRSLIGFNSYSVELSANDSAFRRIVFSATVDSPFVQTTPLDSNRYYWHVKASTGGRETPWSATWWFLRSSPP